MYKQRATEDHHDLELYLVIIYTLEYFENFLITAEQSAVFFGLSLASIKCILSDNVYSFSAYLVTQTPDSIEFSVRIH